MQVAFVCCSKTCMCCWALAAPSQMWHRQWIPTVHKDSQAMTRSEQLDFPMFPMFFLILASLSANILRNYVQNFFVYLAVSDAKSKTKQHSVAPNHHPAILSGMMAKSLLSAATHACRCDLTNQQVKFAPLLMLAIFPSLACGDKDVWTVSGFL